MGQHVQAQAESATRTNPVKIRTSENTAAPMRIVEKGVYRRPHLYSLTPMIRIKLDLGSLEDWPSSRLPHFTERLLSVLPGLRQHGCCFHRPGGFVQRHLSRSPLEKP